MLVQHYPVMKMLEPLSGVVGCRWTKLDEV